MRGAGALPELRETLVEVGSKAVRITVDHFGPSELVLEPVGRLFGFREPSAEGQGRPIIFHDTGRVESLLLELGPHPARDLHPPLVERWSEEAFPVRLP